MSWTTPDDVADSWIGPDAPTDDVLLQKWIDRAEREVRYRVPDVQIRLDAEASLLPPATDLLDMTRDVVVAMVTRVFRNPEGIRTVNQASGTGPFSESKSHTYGGDQPGGLAMTADEVAKLSGGGAGGAFSIDLMPSDAMRYSPVRWLQL
jgi:hypothetical protein